METEHRAVQGSQPRLRGCAAAPARAHPGRRFQLLAVRGRARGGTRQRRRRAPPPHLQAQGRGRLAPAGAAAGGAGTLRGRPGSEERRHPAAQPAAGLAGHHAAPLRRPAQGAAVPGPVGQPPAVSGLLSGRGEWQGAWVPVSAGTFAPPPHQLVRPICCHQWRERAAAQRAKQERVAACLHRMLHWRLAAAWGSWRGRVASCAEKRARLQRCVALLRCGHGARRCVHAHCAPLAVRPGASARVPCQPPPHAPPALAPAAAATARCTAPGPPGWRPPLRAGSRPPGCRPCCSTCGVPAAPLRCAAGATRPPAPSCCGPRPAWWWPASPTAPWPLPLRVRPSWMLTRAPLRSGSTKPSACTL